MGADADGGGDSPMRWLDRADLVRGSDEDFDWMSMSPAELLNRGPVAVVRTVGPDGVEVHLRVGRNASGVCRSVPVVDTVGAGDSFCGAMLTQLHEPGRSGSWHRRSD